MDSKNTRHFFSDVDQLVERTPLDLVLQHYGLPLCDSNAREYRMKCAFNETCSELQYGNLAVKLDVAKQIYCHSCSVRGNLLTLIHGLENHRAPEGGRLRGQEFKAAVVKLREINGMVDSPTPVAAKKPDAKSKQVASHEVVANVKPPSFNVNLPMHRHEKEAARALADLHTDLLTDLALMSPDASAYLLKRKQWLTPELMQKWGVGWIPGNGRSLFRKYYITYTHRNTRGDVVSYSGRDLNFEAKWEKWLQAGKPDGKKPNKHRFVSGFKRGSELYGGHVSRLDDPVIGESLQRIGLIVVEGMNDVIRLDAMGICAVGLCSNQATNQQIEMLTKFASRVANNQIVLLPDSDSEGEAGFKDLLWELQKRDVTTNVAFVPPEMGTQPEDLKGPLPQWV